MLRLRARDLIRDLKTLLDERYRNDKDGSSIIKEVLQNADDVRATKVWLAWVEGEMVPEGCNPLLGRPGFLLVNDAGFEAKHEEAFTSFSTSSKDADAAQIGRFGIGRKSLFHWSEAVCYLGVDASGATRAGVLDPWAEQAPDGGYTDKGNPRWIQWREVEAGVLRDRIRRCAPELGSQWFGIWLAARDARLDGKRVIVKTEPTKAALPTDIERLSGVAGLLPQLVALREIEVVSMRGGERAVAGRIERRGDSLGRPGADGRGFQNERRGEVIVTAGPATRVLHYRLAEACTWTPELKDLRDHPAWPEEPAADFENVDEGPMKAKAEPHGAVTVVWQAERVGALSLVPAIFLPVSGSRLLERFDLPDLSLSCDVLLHGYFFPDSGRQEIEGLGIERTSTQDASAEVRRKWNVGVRQQVTLPLVLPAFASALAELAPAARLALIDALARSTLAREEVDALTRDVQLGCGPGFEFELLRGDSPWVELPSGSDAAMNVALERAGRATRESGVSAVWAERRGVLSPARAAKWSVPLVERLASTLAEAFGKAPGQWLPWVSRWLETARFEEGAGPAPVVRQLYLACLYHSEWRPLLEHSAWAEVVRHLSPESAPVLWAKMPIIDAFRGIGSPEQRLSGALSAIILGEAANVGAPEARISTADAVTALRAIARSFSQKRSVPLTQLAALMLDAADWDAVVQSRELRDVAFLPAWTSEHSRTLVDLPALERATSARLVYALRGTLQPESLAKALSNALQGEPEIVLLDSVVASKLALGPFDIEAVASAVCERRVVSATQLRVALLLQVKQRLESTFVTPDRFSDPIRLALRRLLGGSAEVDAATTLLVLTGGLPQSLVAPLLGSESWRVLDEFAAKCVKHDLPGAWRDALAVQDADASLVVSAVQRLADNGPALDQTLAALGDQDRASLATYLLEDRELWCSIPIHQTTDGRWVDLSARAYLASKYPVPEALDYIDLIEEPVEPAYANALRRMLQPWSAVALAKLGLARHAWHLVLTALGSKFDVDAICRATEIATAPWLPLLSGERAAPGRTILDPRLRDVTRNLPVQPKDIAFKDELAPEVSRHPNWERAETLLTTGASAVAILLAQLHEQGAQPELAVGMTPSSSGSPMWLRTILAADPVWVWWQVVVEVAPELARQQVTLVSGACSPRRAKSLLRQAMSFEKSLSDEAVTWYDTLLSALKVASGYVSPPDVAGLSLPDATKTLRPTCELVRGTQALPPQHRVHSKLEQLFAVPPVPGLASSDELNRIIDPEKWIAPWDDGKTPASLLGYLMSLFNVGDDPYATPLFRRLLPSDSPEAIARRILETSGAPREEIDNRIARAKHLRFRIEQVVPDSRHRMQALDGTALEVSLQSDNKTLLVDVQQGLGGAHAAKGQGLEAAAMQQLELMRPTRRVRLWRLERSTDPEDRNELIKTTIESVVTNLYGLKPKRPQLDQLVAKQSEGAQHVLVAQHRLVQRLPSSLRQLRVHQKHKPLDVALTAIERAEHADAELKAMAGGGSSPDLAAAGKALDDARRRLRALVEHDADAQAHILEALRARLKEFQYGEDQVLFELFQNADDAYAQRSAASDGADEPSFAVELQSEPSAVTLCVRHRGRFIDRLYRPEDADQGWNRDLVNMLAVGFSDKGSKDTGRFGLGFKSVYLLADDIAIQSGRTAIKVVGGVLPFSTHAFASPEETTFRLVLNEDARREAILGRFERLSPLLPLFSQQISHVSLRVDAKDTLHNPVWDTIADDPSPPVPIRLFSANVSAPHSDVGGRWLVARDTRTGRGVARVVALHIRAGEFVAAKDLPAIWVTTPTRETRKLGFLVGGPFGIDVGRGRLGDESAEIDPAVGEIVQLARRALELIEDQLLRDEDALAFTLGLGARPATAASTLLDVLAHSHSGGQESWEWRLARQVLAPPLLNRVLLITDATGVRRKASDVERVLSEELARPAVWAVIRQHFPVSGHAISDRRARLLQDLGYGGPLTLTSVMDAVEATISRRARLSPEVAERLLELEALSPAGSDGDESHTGLAPKTWSELRGFVSDLIVAHQANGTTRVGDVLLDEGSGAGDEEAAVAAFAPAARRLATDNASVARCIRVFRSRDPISSEEMFGWAAQASTEEARDAVASYLFHGTRRDLLIPRLRGAMPDWLHAKRIRAVGSRLQAERADIDGLLMRLALVTLPPEFLVRETLVELPSPRLTLGMVVQWWQANASSIERDYQKRLYPEPWSDRKRLSDALKSGDRRAWSTLFALASCQRIGRVQPGQNRGFLASRADWLETLAEPSSSPERWVALIDDWALGNWLSGEYAHWVGLFPTFRLLWLAMRAEVLQVLGSRPPVEQEPWQVFHFPSNEALSGTGVSVPSLVRAFGKKGTVWIARELVRLGVWEFDPRQRYYVPWKLAGLMTTGSSDAEPEAIAKALERATQMVAPFGRCFDLPFDILRFDKSLRDRLRITPLDANIGDDWALDETEFEVEE